jgi:hypothetical protein
MGPDNTYEVMVVKGADLNSAADVTGGTWAPGFRKHAIHAVALLNHNAAAAAGVLKVDKRVTFKSDTGRGDGDIASLTIPSGLAAGAVLYQRCNPPVIMEPGTEAVCQVTDVTGAGDLADIVFLVEVIPEEPANMSAMVATA